MLKSYDIICDVCDNVEEVFIDSGEKYPKCSMCGGEMKRMFSSMNFKLNFNSRQDYCGWADTGYASSQYWRHVKEANEKTGIKHKGITEN